MMIKTLLAVAMPMFVLACLLAYQRKRHAINIYTLRLEEVQEATAPRLAGGLLLLSLLLLGIAGTLRLIEWLT